MKLLNSRFIFLDVAQCDRDNYGSFSFNIGSIESKPHTSYRLHLRKAVIPFDWTALNESNNKISFGIPTEPLVCDLPLGNPNVLDLVRFINTGQELMRVAFDPVSSRFTFSNIHDVDIILDSNFEGAALKVLGLEREVMVLAPGYIHVAPNMADVRPSPILQVRVNLPTSGSEIIGGAAVNRGLLAAIGMDCAPFSVKVWRDSGLYWSPIYSDKQRVSVWFSAPDGTAIVPQSPPYLIWCVDEYLDDEAALVGVQRESLKLQRYDMLLRHGDKLAAAPGEEP